NVDHHLAGAGDRIGRLAIGSISGPPWLISNTAFIVPPGSNLCPLWPIADIYELCLCVHFSRSHVGPPPAKKSSRGGANMSTTSVSSWHQPSCSTPLGIEAMPPASSMRRSLSMRNSILPLTIHTSCSCGCEWAATCVPAPIFHHTIMPFWPASTRRVILSVIFSSGIAAKEPKPLSVVIAFPPLAHPTCGSQHCGSSYL